MPDMAGLVEGMASLKVRFLLCELALEAKDLKPEDLREGVEIVGATSFMADAEGVGMTLAF